MSPHLDTLSWLRANQSLVFLLNAVCLAEKQQIPIWQSLGWPDRGLNPRSTTLEVSMLTITPPMCFYTPTCREEAILQSPCPFVRPSVSPSVHLSVRLSVRSHFRNRYLSFYWKKWLHIYFLFTVRVFLAWLSMQHLIFLAKCKNIL